MKYSMWIKMVSTLLVLILLSGLPVLSVWAAQDTPYITLQPQSPNYPEYSVAIYTVEASGKNLTATWYMDWQGKTYTISGQGGSMQPWEAYAGEAYGPRQLDSNTFAFIFEGIEYDLDGAYIWCVLEDGHYDVTSQKARISVGNPASPPEILDIPSELTVEQGEPVEIRCVAKAPEGTQLSFLWYESSTGRMEDIMAVNRGTEDCDFLICDTSTPGIYNYVCFINTSEGGFANSSFVTVTVIPHAVPPEVTQPEVTEPTTAPTEPTTTPTEPATTPTEPAVTQPVTQPSTAEPTQGVTAATEATPTEPTPQQPAPQTFPWWAVLLVGFAGVGAGVGITVVILKKK